MAALPYMQLYTTDYKKHTVHLDATQHGAYLLLLMHYWEHGGAIDNTDERLRFVCKFSKKKLGKTKSYSRRVFHD